MSTTSPATYPLGRNDLGRSPASWFLNLYAEYSLKLGKNTLQFSVNVDNVTDNDTATWYYTCVNTAASHVLERCLTRSSSPVVTRSA